MTLVPMPIKPGSVTAIASSTVTVHYCQDPPNSASISLLSLHGIIITISAKLPQINRPLSFDTGQFRLINMSVNCCSKFFLILGIGRLVMTEYRVLPSIRYLAEPSSRTDYRVSPKKLYFNYTKYIPIVFQLQNT